MRIVKDNHLRKKKKEKKRVLKFDDVNIGKCSSFLSKGTVGINKGNSNETFNNFW